MRWSIGPTDEFVGVPWYHRLAAATRAELVAAIS